MVKARWRLLGLLLCFMLTVGCVRGCKSRNPAIHPNPNMDYQERVNPQSESEFFYDGISMRQPVEHTIARDELIADNAYATGKTDAGTFLASNARVVDQDLLKRGEERYEIFCTPCHASDGLGQGILTTRGNIPVPSFNDERLMALRDGEIYDTIANGKGLMPSYAYPIPVEDRWAIVAWVRELQGNDPAAMNIVASPTPETSAESESGDEVPTESAPAQPATEDSTEDAQ